MGIWERLSGSIPSFPKYSNLTTFKSQNDRQNRLNTTGLTGHIPHISAGDSLSLAHFMVLYNSISGSIPDQMLQSSTLQTFRLSYNQASGTLPVAVAGSNLTVLDVHNNRLSGVLALDHLAGRGRLAEVQLQSNNFTGFFPQVAFTGVKHWFSFNNHLSGTFASSIGDWRSLANFMIGENLISGVLPSTFAKLRGLAVLELTKNKLEGDLSNLWVSKSMRSLHVQHNKLSGKQN